MDNDKKKAQESWERFLNPELLRPNLMVLSIYIATFEILKDSIIGRIRDFYWVGFDEKNETIDPRYQSEVLAKNKSAVYASLQWLKESGAINDDDIATFDRVKQYRNDIAHKMFHMLSEGLPFGFEEQFGAMVALLNKIETWWIINVNLQTNPDFDGKEIDEKEVIPGRIAGLQMLLDIALGSDEKSKYYFNELVKMKNKEQ